MAAWRTAAFLATVAIARATLVPMDSWMTALYPVIANVTLLDLSLPGTHDSMTWDLSTTVGTYLPRRNETREIPC